MWVEFSSYVTWDVGGRDLSRPLYSLPLDYLFHSLFCLQPRNILPCNLNNLAMEFLDEVTDSQLMDVDAVQYEDDELLTFAECLDALSLEETEAELKKVEEEEEKEMPSGWDKAVSGGPQLDDYDGLMDFVTDDQLMASCSQPASSSSSCPGAHPDNLDESDLCDADLLQHASTLEEAVTCLPPPPPMKIITKFPPKPKNPILDRWTELQDVFGWTPKWPRHITQMFWEAPTYRSRLSLMCFAWINAFDPELVIEWFYFVGELTPSRNRHFHSILKDLESGKYNKVWYAYNMFEERHQYMDGSPVPAHICQSGE